MIFFFIAMWFPTGNGSQIANFKNKICSKKYHFGRSNSVEQLEIRKRNAFSAEVGEWQYVNFNTTTQNNDNNKRKVNEKNSSNRRSSMVIQSLPVNMMWSGSTDRLNVLDSVDGCRLQERSTSECIINGNDESPNKIQSTTSTYLRKSRPLSWLYGIISEESRNFGDQECKFQTKLSNFHSIGHAYLRY